MNIYLVLLLLVVIVLFANVAMFGLVRGSRSMKFDWFNNTKNELAKPFQEDSELNELRQRIEDLSGTDKEFEEKQ